MVLDIGISDVLSITQTIGIIGTLLIALYFSRRQTRELSVDIEAQVLSDLDEKMRFGYYFNRIVEIQKSSSGSIDQMPICTMIE